MNVPEDLAKLLARMRRALDERRYRKLQRMLRRLGGANDAIAEGGPGLLVLCADADIDPRRLTRDGLLLDQETIDRHYEEGARPLGAIKPHLGSRFSRTIALRFARRCGARLAETQGLDSDSAMRAWFFAIWTEVCTLVPARHLARRLAANARGELFIIPLPSLSLRYLGLWDKNELEPLYLAAELRQAGANVVLWIKQEEGAQAGSPPDEIELTAGPHPDCCPWTTASEPGQSDGQASLLVTSALGGLDRIRDYCPDALTVQSIFATSNGPFEFGLLPPGSPRPVPWTRHFRRRASIGGGRLQVYRAEALPSDLLVELVQAIRDVTTAAFRRACEVVERLEVRGVHICDHTFLESAVLAEATRRHGGRVFVWPHSSNAVHVEARASEQLARVTCVTRSAAENWIRHRPDLDCRIDSSLMLRPPAGARSFDPKAPLTVVVIAGAHKLARMPLLDHGGHRSTYRSLFAGLAALNPRVDVVFKPKWQWESSAWLQQAVGDVSFVTFTDRHPNEIEAPNMIFLTVAFASTALLEGLGRGIPCMVAREIDVEDYVTIDPAVVPVGDVATILSKIAACTDPTVFSALIEQQLSWYAAETHFPSSAGELG